MLVPSSYVAPVTIAVCATRDRARALARSAFPRRRCRLVLTRTAAELERTFRETLVDAAVVDVHAPSEDAWQAVGLAAEFPSAPFFALTPLRPSDASIVARCAAAEVADLVTEGVDDGVLRDLVLPRTFTARFTDALRDPPSTLGLGGQLHLATWRFLVAHGGRGVRTDTNSAAVGVSLASTSAAPSAPAARPTSSASSTWSGSWPRPSWRKIPATTWRTWRGSSSTPPRRISRRPRNASPVPSRHRLPGSVGSISLIGL
jgi:hypothetical protein